MTDQTAVLLMAYGGPDSLEDVEPYLLDVRGGRATSPELVEEIRERYAAIGGKSPLLDITNKQARALEEKLNQQEPGRYRVFVGMRHWKPCIREVVGEIYRSGIADMIAICMTPFSSRMSTGAYFEHLEQAIEAVDPQSQWRQSLKLRKIGAWYDHPGFIRALAECVQEGLAQLDGAQAARPLVLFTAHSLPAALAEQGDPYARQFAELCGLVAQAAGLPSGAWLSCYQSAGAQSTRWLGPSLDETIHNLAAQGGKYLLVSPIGFLSDHVEVLYDIDIEAREEAQELGVFLARTRSMNDRPLFVEALAEIIQSAG